MIFLNITLRIIFCLLNTYIIILQIYVSGDLKNRDTCLISSENISQSLDIMWKSKNVSMFN